MKYLLGLFLLIPSSVHAQQGVQLVHETYTSTSTIIQTVTLCASNGVQNITAFTSSGTLAGYQDVEINNPLTSTSTAVCSFDPMLSTQTWSVWYGREISSGAAGFPNPFFTFRTTSANPLYCMTKNSAGCQPLTVIQ